MSDYAVYSLIPNLTTSDEQVELMGQLSWDWSETAKKYLTAFDRMHYVHLNLEDLKMLLKSNWGFCNQALLEAQTELSGLSIQIPDDHGICTLGFAEISETSDWHVLDHVSESFFVNRSSTAFSFSLDHSGCVLFEDCPHSVNIQVFIEKQASLFALSSRKDIGIMNRISGVELPVRPDLLIVRLLEALRDTDFKYIHPTRDVFGCVWESSTGYGVVNQSMVTNRSFVCFESPSRELIETVADVLKEFGEFSLSPNDLLAEV